MTCPCSVSRYRWLRNLCSLVCAVVGCCSLPAARAQSPDLEKPLLNIDEDISAFAFAPDGEGGNVLDRKSTRLNSSHANISYAVFCLKKKKNIDTLYCAYQQVTAADSLDA